MNCASHNLTRGRKNLEICTCDGLLSFKVPSEALESETGMSEQLPLEHFRGPPDSLPHGPLKP